MKNKKKEGFCSPFTPRYWRLAAAEFGSLRMLVIAALMIALRVVLGMLVIPVVGGIGDILGFVIFPTGAFFPGYTLSAILTNLVFGLFLYRREISWLRVALSRLVTNLFINVCLGSLWSKILYQKGWLYYAGTSVVKNLVLWPVEVVVLIALLTLLLPVLTKLGLVPYQEKLKKI